MKKKAHAWFQKQREETARQALHAKRMKHYLETGTFDDPRDALIEISRPLTTIKPKV